MREVVGHDRVKKILAGSLPSVSLFLGPASVGKRTLAEFLWRHHGVSPADVVGVQKLTASAARSLVGFASTTAHTSVGKLAIVELDGATPAAVHMLLKVIEDAQDTKFILISQNEPLPTIVSRSQVFEFGLLTTSEVTKVLSANRGFRDTEAGRLAILSGGQVKRALEAAVGHDEKNNVLLALKAFRERSGPSLEKLADRWSEATTELLVTWCGEAITQRWRLFSDDESDIQGREIPLKILLALDADTRPKLVVRSSLMNVLRSL